MSPYLTAMQTLFGGDDLDPAVARALVDAMLAGAVEPPRVAAVLAALRMKGQTVDELVALAESMRAHMLTVPVRVDRQRPLFDVTGSGSPGFAPANLHTLVAFVMAAGGVRVAKQVHGGAEGRCGSSDLLEALGVPVAVEPARVGALVDEVGLGFLYVPVCHPGLRHVGAVRQALGFQTLFSLLGPLCNPARPDCHLVGVSPPRAGGRVAEALLRLGCQRALVVCGEDGRDELSLGARSRTWLASQGTVQRGLIDPEELGFERLGRAALAGEGDESGDRESGCCRGISRRACSTGGVERGGGVVVGGGAGSGGGIWAAEELLRTGAAGKMLASYARRRWRPCRGERRLDGGVGGGAGEQERDASGVFAGGVVGVGCRVSGGCWGRTTGRRWGCFGVGGAVRGGG
ncbi:MAG: anthranilate phosphoribosyltransferase [bacterium]